MASLVIAASKVTDLAGNASFTFPEGMFEEPPVVQTTVQSGNTNVTEAIVTALTVESCTVNVRASAGLEILGLTVLGLPAVLAGATVHLFAAPADPSIT